jgi:hypothetical protein
LIGYKRGSERKYLDVPESSGATLENSYRRLEEVFFFLWVDRENEALFFCAISSLFN